ARDDHRLPQPDAGAPRSVPAAQDAARHRLQYPESGLNPPQIPGRVCALPGSGSMKIPVSFCGAILLGTLLCSPAFADDCAMPHATALMLEAQRGLGALPVGDGMQTDVPAKGSALISAFKSRMNDYVSASMRCHPGNLNPTV